MIINRRRRNSNEMISFILLGALAMSVLAAPQGYEYKRPVNALDSFKSIGVPKALPCNHATAHGFDGVPLALIQSQSEGRIVNHKANYGANHNLVAAASGYSPQLQSHPLSNGENLPTQILPPINAPPQHFSSGGNRQQTSSSQSHGYTYNQATEAVNDQHQNYPAPQYTQAAHNLIQSDLSSHSLVNAFRPVTPSLIGNNLAFGSGNAAFQHGAGSFSNSFGHATSSAASASTHHNIQQVSAVGSNFANSVLSSGGSEAYTGSLLNAASQQSAAFNSIKHTANTNLDFNVEALNGQLGHVIRETFANAPLDPSIEKHIYVHVPPEDLEENDSPKLVNQQQHLTPAKKHYKIIFIKAPSYPTPNYSQLAAAAAPQTEEKTLVYVLVKKPEVPSLEQIQQLQQSSYKSSKPEVYFIKYKTRKEGDSSQYSLNSQYPNDIIDKQPIDAHPSESGNELIDIRSGGSESSSISMSNSYSSSSSNGVITNEPKHELYGVPLQ